MGRVRGNIWVAGQDLWTLFDTGARSSYVTRGAVESLRLPTLELFAPRSVALGGAHHEVTRSCLLSALVEGKQVEISARIVERIGTDETGREIVVLFGALSMQEWGIRPIPDEERLDMTFYTGELAEFCVR